MKYIRTIAINVLIIIFLSTINISNNDVNSSEIKNLINHMNLNSGVMTNVINLIKTLSFIGIILACLKISLEKENSFQRKEEINNSLNEKQTETEKNNKYKYKNKLT